MGFADIEEWIEGEWAIIHGAPISFLVAVIAAGVLLRWIVRGHYETRIANMQSTIEMLEKQIDRKEARSAVLDDVPTPPELAPRDTSVAVSLTEQEIPAKLVALYRSYTKLQAASIMEQYYGQRMKITGSVQDVREPRGDGSVNIILDTEDYLCFFYFKEVTDRLKQLRKGDKITAEGTLILVDNYGLDFENCLIL